MAIMLMNPGNMPSTREAFISARRLLKRSREYT